MKQSKPAGQISFVDDCPPRLALTLKTGEAVTVDGASLSPESREAIMRFASTLAHITSLEDVRPVGAVLLRSITVNASIVDGVPGTAQSYSRGTYFAADNFAIISAVLDVESEMRKADPSLLPLLAHADSAEAAAAGTHVSEMQTNGAMALAKKYSTQVRDNILRRGAAA